jgi:hypothetical protein
MTLPTVVVCNSEATRQDVFLRALAQAFPTGQARAVLVGAPLFREAEAAYAAKLVLLARELGIESRVDFRRHRGDIAYELHQMDLLVHASTIPEPFGQVVIEGISAHLPVVAPRRGGPEQTITEGVDGLLHPCGDGDAPCPSECRASTALGSGRPPRAEPTTSLLRRSLLRRCVHTNPARSRRPRPDSSLRVIAR